MPAAAMDADRRSTMTDPANALEQWHAVRFEAWKRSRTEAIAVLAQQEEDVYANRRSLVKETRELKELEGEAQQHKVKDLLRLYQTEIDRLAKALKAAHGLYLEAFDPLRALPDPSDALASTRKDGASLGSASFQDLEFIVSERDAEVSAAREELALYKQRDVVRETKIAELYSELEDLQAFRVSNVQKDAIIREQAEQIADINARLAAKDADEKEKRHLVAELREHADSVMKLTLTNRDLETRLSEMQQDISKSKNNVVPSDSLLILEVEELKRTISDRETQIETYKNEILELQSKCEAARELAEMAEQASAFEGQVFTLQYELKSAQDELEKRECLVADLEKRVQTLAETEASRKAALLELQNQADSKASDLVKAESTTASLNSQVEQLLQVADQTEKAMDLLRNEVGEKQKIISSLQDAALHNSKSSALVLASKEAAEARVSQLESQIAAIDLQSDDGHLAEDLKNAQLKVAKLETELQESAKKVANLKSEHEQVYSTLESMRAALQASEAECSRLIVDRDAMLLKLDGNAQSFDERVALLEAENLTAQEITNTLSSECDELRKLLSASCAARDELDTKLKAEKEALEIETTLLSESRAKLTESQLQLQQKSTLISSMEYSFAKQIEDLRSALNSDIELLQARLEVARIDAETYEQKCLELQVELDVLQSGATTRGHQSSERERNLEQELITVREELKALKDEVDLDEKEQLRQELMRTIAELDTLRASATNSIEVDTLRATIFELEAQLESHRLDMADLQAGLAASNSQAQASNRAVDDTALQAEIAQLRQQQKLFDSILYERDAAQTKVVELERAMTAQPPAPQQQSNQPAHESDLAMRTQSLTQQLYQRNAEIHRLQSENRTLNERLRTIETTSGFEHDCDQTDVLLPMASSSTFTADTRNSGIFVALWNATEQKLRVLNRSDRTLWRAGRVIMTNSLARRAILIYLAVIHSLVIVLVYKAAQGCPHSSH